MSKFKTASVMMQEWEETSTMMRIQAEIRADERRKTLEFVSKRGNTIIVGGRSAEERRRYWVDAMLKEMQKEAT